MESIETLIPDNEGNHLVVVLYFYDNQDKIYSFQIPAEYLGLDIIDINIRKLNLDKPLGTEAFFKMCQWLINQLSVFPNAVFSFICSTDALVTHHEDLHPSMYRWRLFECLYSRYKAVLSDLNINSKEIIVGPEDYQTNARVFYRNDHSPIIHIVEAHLKEKYGD